MTSPDTRGHTTIAERAVARIVRHALREDAGGLGESVSGRGVGRGPIKGRGPRVDVSVKGTLVTARVRLAVMYPEPVREVASRVRERVRDRVQDLTGLTVRQVDVDVAGLERREAGPERSRRVVR
ncbi:Asp23/Gls24 family envelope stress response protein [Actinomadura rugatobispora]|uniref:Asp23/Gls24 family envelope stress response protein n=1 Tax=Actinomadura rugatobispora TaxID=1994 RepID=A0ABW0ZUK4_9ACTN|nr:hypothetical protein GCM10010200_028750 [Actinomadura rugatobispora]